MSVKDGELWPESITAYIDDPPYLSVDVHGPQFCRDFHIGSIWAALYNFRIVLAATVIPAGLFLAFFGMRRFKFVNDMLVWTLLTETTFICITYNTFVYFNTESSVFYVIFISAGLLGATIGYFVYRNQRTVIFTRIVQGFLCGLTLSLYISFIGLYNTATLWVMYPMMLVLSLTMAYVSYHHRDRYWVELVTQSFLGTAIVTTGLGLGIGKYPNPFLQPTLKYY
jgi:Domain of unknown function (DUF4203)